MGCRARATESRLEGWVVLTVGCNSRRSGPRPTWVGGAKHGSLPFPITLMHSLVLSVLTPPLSILLYCDHLSSSFSFRLSFPSHTSPPISPGPLSSSIFSASSVSHPFNPSASCPCPSLPLPPFESERTSSSRHSALLPHPFVILILSSLSHSSSLTFLPQCPTTVPYSGSVGYLRVKLQASYHSTVCDTVRVSSCLIIAHHQSHFKPPLIWDLTFL
jgi:hypothetical protein